MGGEGGRRKFEVTRGASEVFKNMHLHKIQPTRHVCLGFYLDIPKLIFFPVKVRQGDLSVVLVDACAYTNTQAHTDTQRQTERQTVRHLKADSDAHIQMHTQATHLHLGTTQHIHTN